MKYWTNWQAPLINATTHKKILDVPLNAIVDVNFEGDEYFVSWRDNHGIMDKKYLEPFVHALPSDCVDMDDIQTPDPNDAAQYILRDGVKQVNMCGQMCMAYLLELPLKTVLDEWQAKDPSMYQRIFRTSKKATGTSDGDLIHMLGLFGEKAHSLTMKKYSPATLKPSIIASCNIDGGTGALRGAGVLHWVVVVDVVPDRQGFGWIDVFNPFQNCVERYSWREWLASTRNSPYGVEVE